MATTIFNESLHVTELTTEHDFFKVLALEHAIIYMLVNWSGPERESRRIVSEALTGLKPDGTPVFVIDCSEQDKQYVVEWLRAQNQENNDFYFGGWGETLLIKKGVIVDHIKYPAKFGLSETKQKLAEWKNVAD